MHDIYPLHPIWFTSTAKQLKLCGYLSVKQMLFYHSKAVVHNVLVPQATVYCYQVIQAGLFINYANQCQGQVRDKQVQAKTRQGQAGTRQGQTGTDRDGPCLSLIFPVFNLCLKKKEKKETQ